MTINGVINLGQPLDLKKYIPYLPILYMVS